jgi:hypothetical protein
VVLLAPLLIGFLPLVAAVVLLGLAHSLGSQTGTASTGGFWYYVSGQALFKQISGLAAQATRALTSRFAASQLKMMTAYLHAMARLWKQEFAAMRAEAKATAAVAGAIEQAIPREAHKAAAPALARAKVADRHAEHALAQGRSTAKELHRFRATTRARLRADAHAIDVTIPHDIAGLRRRTRAVEDAQAKDRTAIGELENGATKVWDWIRTHPLGVAAGAFAGAVAIALSRLGLGSLNCRNFKGLNKRGGCSTWSSLEGLLGLVATAIAVHDLEALAKDGQAVEHAVTAGFADLVGLGDLFKKL